MYNFNCIRFFGGPSINVSIGHLVVRIELPLSEWDTVSEIDRMNASFEYPPLLGGESGDVASRRIANEVNLHSFQF